MINMRNKVQDRGTWRINKIRVLFIVIWLLFMVMLIPAGALEVTPNHVYMVIDRADQLMNSILKAKGMSLPPEWIIPEKGLKPMHTYQILVATMDRLIELEKMEGMRPMPKIVATPTDYIPADILIMVTLLLNEVQRVMSVLRVQEPAVIDEQLPYGKTPTDISKKTLQIFMKLGLLLGNTHISPNENYAHIARAVSDVQSILTNIDASQRYRIDAPPSKPGITPSDVYRQCLLIRRDINELRRQFSMELIPVPTFIEGQTLQPADVFVQILIIIAELNLLKMKTDTISATPLAIPVVNKNPQDVHQQALMVQYLLSQIFPLKAMMALESGKTIIK